jgi:hypothetical protein
MPTPDQITRAYQGAVERLRRDTVSAVESLWYNLPNYRDADIARFKSVAIPTVQGALSQMAALTAGYQSQVLREVDLNVPMVMLPREQIGAPRAVDPNVVYQRPATVLYTSLSRGSTMTTAVVAGFDRLRSLVQTDLQLVKVAQSDLSLSRGGVTLYKRRLTGLENCDLCSIASTNTYSVGNLMPIHNGCDCTVEAIQVGGRPSQTVDLNLADKTHGHIAELEAVADDGGSAAAYRELTEVSEHGEIGPYLRWRSDNFTGPDDL